jgi:prevent-host-death family protein
MKTITMTELRKEPGERIRDVFKNGESFLITKDGKPVARLIPVDDVSEPMADVRELRRRAGY